MLTSRAPPPRGGCLGGGGGPFRLRPASLGRPCWRALGPRPAANPLRQRRTGMLSISRGFLKIEWAAGRGRFGLYLGFKGTHGKTKRHPKDRQTPREILGKGCRRSYQKRAFGHSPREWNKGNECKKTFRTNS